MKYDKKEKAIIDAYEKGKMKLSAPSKKEIEAIKATARKTLVKDRRITIRLDMKACSRPLNHLRKLCSGTLAMVAPSEWAPIRMHQFSQNNALNNDSQRRRFALLLLAD